MLENCLLDPIERFLAPLLIGIHNLFEVVQYNQAPLLPLKLALFDPAQYLLCVLLAQGRLCGFIRNIAHDVAFSDFVEKQRVVCLWVIVQDFLVIRFCFVDVLLGFFSCLALTLEINYHFLHDLSLRIGLRLRYLKLVDMDLVLLPRILALGRGPEPFDLTSLYLFHLNW